MTACPRPGWPGAGRWPWPRSRARPPRRGRSTTATTCREPCRSCSGARCGPCSTPTGWRPSRRRCWVRAAGSGPGHGVGAHPVAGAGHEQLGGGPDEPADGEEHARRVGGPELGQDVAPADGGISLDHQLAGQTTLRAVPLRNSSRAATTDACQSVAARGLVTVKRVGPAVAGPDGSSLKSTSGMGASTSRRWVTHCVPSSARPTITRGTMRSPAQAGSNGRAPNATGPVPGTPTSSSISMAASAACTVPAAAAGSPAGTPTRRTSPRPARPVRRRAHTTPSAPATSSRSTSASRRRVRATSGRAGAALTNRPDPGCRAGVGRCHRRTATARCR